MSVLHLFRYSGNGQDSVGYAAHVGGCLAGFLVGINVIRNLRHKKWEVRDLSSDYSVIS